MISITLTKARTYFAAVTDNDLSRKLVRGGLAALFIKVGAAGLSFLMFLVLARAMSPENFGRFGFGFSLANLLAIAGSFGQSTLVLRFVPIYDAKRDCGRLTGVIREGYRIILFGCCVLGLITVFATLTIPELKACSYLVAAGLFTVVFGLARYQAFVLRGFGGMTLALAPRDLVWRAGVILAAGAAALGLVPKLSAASGLYLLSGLLAGIVVAQALFHPATRPRALFAEPAVYERLIWRRTALALWGTSIVRAAVPNLAVVLLGVVLKPEATGAFFAAFRVAMLLNLFLLAANMIAAPMIAANHNKEDIDAVRKICAFTSVGTTVPTAICFLIFVLFGRPLLSLFSPGFESGYLILLVIAFGYLVKVICGPTTPLLQMSGNEKVFLKISLWINVISLLLILPLTYILGEVGAAFSVAFELMGTSVWGLIAARRAIGMDPSLLGVIRMGL